MAALDRDGVWRYAGMKGALVGLELSEALATLPADLNHDLARRLFVIAEANFLRVIYAERENQADA